jgi:hypothetical protein
MTPGEVERFCEGAMWRMRSQAQFDYMLADLIGVSSARMMSNEVKFPTLEEVYPSLFEAKPEEAKALEEEQKRITDSTNRFLEFAMKHNAKRRDKGVET